jgi:hypothetical protein
MKTKTIKKFDAVEEMRRIRQLVSDEIKGMSFQEEKKYLKKRVDDYRKRKKK